MKKRSLKESITIPCADLHTPCTNPHTPTKRFGALGPAILGRRDLSMAAKITALGMHMESYNCELMSISHAALARTCGIARHSILRGIRSLQAAGLISAEGDPVMQVQKYRLRAPLFRGGATAKDEAVEANPKPVLVMCPCGNLCKNTPCRKCRNRADMERTARRVYAEEKRNEQSCGDAKEGMGPVLAVQREAKVSA